jgi:hypothetical protein
MDGKIPPPKEDAKVSVISINVGSKKMIMTIHETVRSITIYVGNKTVYCIDVMLEKAITGELYDTGYLSKIRWDKVCTLDNDFEKGNDSIMLVKLILSYINSHYPSVKSLRFTDLSTKECDDGSTINLAALKYLTNGKTWYEEKFGASVDEERKLFFDIMNKQLLEKKKNTSWDLLKTRIPVDKLSIPEDEVKDLYMRSSTWQEFFYPIRERLGVSRTCIIFSPWFNQFASGYLKISYISLQYSLPVKDHGIPYTMSGGRRRTIKNKK